MWWRRAGVWDNIASFCHSELTKELRAGTIMEVSPIRNSLQDIDERVTALRGYL
jgi:hypothetical protein